MPQRYSQKPVNTFIKGLVTEASEMTFPENASSDELNCDLLQNGARRRRKGVKYETNYQESSFAYSAGDFVHSFTWSNVSGLSGTEFLVIQVKSTLYFYDKSYATLSAGEKTFTVNLSTYSASNGFDAAEEPVQGASVNGQLVVTSAAIDPIKIKYTVSTDTIEVDVVEVNVRDFDQVYKGQYQYDYDIEPTLTQLGGAVTTEDYLTYKYDLFNMGWYARNTGRDGNPTAWDYWDSQESTFPPRSKPWWLAKTSDQRMDTNGLQRTYAGNTLAPVGHYILNFFSKDRQTASGLITSYLPTEVESARFRTVAAYAGRAWFAGLDSSKNGGKVFFSRVIESDSDYSRFHQMSDPTEEDSAGVVDSDGGYLSIPEASNIRVLFPMGSTLLVFAQNGIWIIGGVDQVFKASEFYVKKISPFGIATARSLVDAMGTPFFWDVSGIYAVSTDGNNEAVQQISQPIKSFFEGISNQKKSEVVATFDRLNKRIYWMYPDNDETVSHKFNKVLVLDLELQAFFPWTISDQTTGLGVGETTPFLAGGVFLSGFGSSDTTFDVLSDTDSVLSNTDEVITTISSSGVVNSDIKFIVKTESNKLTFATFTGTDFLDWGTDNFDSYAETGYDFIGDATVKKNNPYITAYMRRTETQFVDEGDGSYSVDLPSSCFLIAKWDLSGDSSRWSTASQLYRLANYPTVNPNDLTFTYPYDTIVTRTKIRGKGRVLRLKFYSEEGKDFYLIGWEQLFAANPRF